MKRTSLVLIAAGFFLAGFSFANQRAEADDFFLTIAGGYSPSGNQASLEKNVLFFQRMLRDQKLSHRPVDIFFADGNAKGDSLQIRDLDSVPLPNRLMAEFFGSKNNLGLDYRPHDIEGVRGETSVENIQQWFDENRSKMKAGDRLFLYVSAHGGNSKTEDQPLDTTIYLWNNKHIKVSELTRHLDSLPEGVDVVTVMVQCHAGGFSNYIFDEGNPDKSVSRQNRCGFFATVYDRPAAGCTPEINEANYEEYSTYFLAALAGETRLGEPIDPPDYNGDGAVSFDEAHAYCVLESDTIDLPVKTSETYLRAASKFGERTSSRLLTKNLAYSEILKLADPVDKAMLTGLSKQLELNGDGRISEARKLGEKRSGRSSRSGRGTSRRRPTSESGKLKQKIVSDMKKRWPGLANTLNPISVELLTTRADEFVKAIEGHKDYKAYREALAKETGQLSADKKRVKYERLVRIAENVILEFNLRQLGDEQKIAQYQRLKAGEASSLKPGK